MRSSEHTETASKPSETSSETSKSTDAADAAKSPECAEASHAQKHAVRHQHPTDAGNVRQNIDPIAVAIHSIAVAIAAVAVATETEPIAVSQAKGVCAPVIEVPRTETAQAISHGVELLRSGRSIVHA